MQREDSSHPAIGRRPFSLVARPKSFERSRTRQTAPTRDNKLVAPCAVRAEKVMRITSDDLKILACQRIAELGSVAACAATLWTLGCSGSNSSESGAGGERNGMGGATSLSSSVTTVASGGSDANGGTQATGGVITFGGSNSSGGNSSGVGGRRAAHKPAALRRAARSQLEAKLTRVVVSPRAASPGWAEPQERVAKAPQVEPRPMEAQHQPAAVRALLADKLTRVE